MKSRYFLALMSLLAFGCAAEVPNSQSAESPTSPTVTTAQSEAQSTTEQDAIKSGTFIAGEHATEGTVRIATQNGKPVLELDQAFKTFDMGPDLVVILHRSDDVLGSTKPPSYPLQKGDYVILAPLQNFSGAQTYSIPENINLEDYKSAVIWCRQFNATFGTARLQPEPSAARPLGVSGSGELAEHRTSKRLGNTGSTSAQ